MQQIPLFKVYMSTDAPQQVSEVLTSGYIGQGPVVENFEASLRDFFNNPFCNTVNSCTSALHLALHMCKDGIKKDVLTTPLTCSATNVSILNNGLNPVWVDINPETLNICIDDLREKLTPSTLAIMVVHWGGSPADLESIEKLTRDHYEKYGYKPAVIEDCAHAFGATYNNKLIGNHGNLAAFSFQAIKHLTCGDGGLLISPDIMLYERSKRLRWYGLDRNIDASIRVMQPLQEAGYKFHMNDIAAAIGLSNIKNIQVRLDAAHANSNFYEDKLNLFHVKTLPNSKSACWVHTLRVDNRGDFVRHMKNKRIEASFIHARNDRLDCFSSSKCHLPQMDLIENDMVCIPCGWWVTSADREYIVDCIQQGW